MQEIVSEQSIKFGIFSCGENNEELRATADIEEGSLIFADVPLLWCALPLQGNQKPLAPYCGQCGKSTESLRESFIRLISPTLDEVFILSATSHFETYISSMATAPIIEDCKCPHCEVVFCSPSCKGQCFAEGHSHICGLNNKHVEDSNGHLALALKAYALVVQTALTTGTTAIEAWKLLFGSFYAANYTETKHAFRTGSIHTAKSTVFTEMIAPAYFAAGLSTTLTFLRQVFLTECYQSIAIEDVLTESYLDSLIGTFVVNNVSFSIFSTLKAFYKKVADSKDGSSAAWDVYADLQSMDVAAQALPAMSCTALCRTFAKLNHECNSSTYVSYGDEGFAQIKVHASRSIATGSTITNSYLHNTGLTKTQRKRALCQYLFECTCPACLAEASDEDEDSDYE